MICLYFLLVLPYILAQTYEASVVYYGADNYTVVSGINKSACAYAKFADTQNVSGWGVLDIVTQIEIDSSQYLCAGIIEGYLTATRINEALINTRSYFSQDGIVPFPSKNLVNFFSEQQAWTAKQCQKPVGTFWLQACLIIAQFNGLVRGVQTIFPDITSFDMMMLNSVGDLFQIMPAVDPALRLPWSQLSRQLFNAAARRSQHCSGLIKVTDDFSDLMWSHSSWFTYGNMNRIYKHYSFGTKLSTPSRALSFSSYPGYLSSLDDFYIMDSGLAMIQTSNNVFNNTILEYIQPQSLLAWQRVRTAHAVASSGPEWYSNFKQFASGTYANQYMIINTNLFTPLTPLPSNTLTCSGLSKRCLEPLMAMLRGPM
jgi:hypothetical protein